MNETGRTPVLLKSKISTIRERFLKMKPFVVIGCHQKKLAGQTKEATEFYIFKSVELPQIHSDNEQMVRKLLLRTSSALFLKVKLRMSLDEVLKKEISRFMPFRVLSNRIPK